MRLAVIIPVSPFEDFETIKKSVEHVKNLNFGCEARIVYVIDKNGEKDERAKKVREFGVEVIERSRRGKRAGAINDALKHLESINPDFVAILDIDTRFEKDFIPRCINALLGDDKAFIASARREIYNRRNLVTETIWAEYKLIGFLLKKSAFKHFNGLVGVLRSSFLREGLREDALTEDSDFSTRMHALGYRALLLDGKVYEQAPISWKDLYKQRKRWYYGGLQLWGYRKMMKKAPFNVRLSWYLALTATYLPILFLPLFPLAIFLLRKLNITFGLIVYALVMQAAAFAAIFSYLRRKEVKWDAIARSD